MNIINSAIIVESTNELKRKSLPHYILENDSNKIDFFDSSGPMSLQEMEKKHKCYNQLIFL
jgi:hypothetical protein